MVLYGENWLDCGIFMGFTRPNGEPMVHKSGYKIKYTFGHYGMAVHPLNPWYEAFNR